MQIANPEWLIINLDRITQLDFITKNNTLNKFPF
jgi:hypothetical protein